MEDAKKIETMKDLILDLIEPFWMHDDVQLFEKLTGTEAQRVFAARKFLRKIGVEFE